MDSTQQHIHLIFIIEMKVLKKPDPFILAVILGFGGHVAVLPGVTIGEGSVIGAGSVVTKDIPPHSLAVGNPCKVVRKIDNEVPSEALNDETLN